MITWSTYREQVRRSVLGDPNGVRWSPEQVHDFIGWALDRFVSHTAYLSTLVINDGDMKQDGITPYDFRTESTIEMPTDIFDDLEVTGRVAITTDKNVTTYYDPVDLTQGLTPYAPTEPSFWVWPRNTINFSSVIGTGSRVCIDYFSYYPTPAIDNDLAVLDVPRWALKPLGTLIGAFALESLAIESANIDRWKDNLDSGSPEDNALRKQMEWQMKQYEYHISQHIPQDRANFFRRYETSEVY